MSRPRDLGPQWLAKVRWTSGADRSCKARGAFAPKKHRAVALWALSMSQFTKLDRRCFNMFQQSVAYAGNLHQSKLGILCSKSNLRDGESKAKSCMTCPTSLGKCSAKVECCPSRFPKFSSNFHMGLSENRVSSFRWAFWGYTPCSDSQITILLLISHIIYISMYHRVFRFFLLKSPIFDDKSPSWWTPLLV